MHLQLHTKIKKNTWNIYVSVQPSTRQINSWVTSAWYALNGDKNNSVLIYYIYFFLQNQVRVIMRRKLSCYYQWRFTRRKCRKIKRHPFTNFNAVWAVRYIGSYWQPKQLCNWKHFHLFIQPGSYRWTCMISDIIRCMIGSGLVMTLSHLEPNISCHETGLSYLKFKYGNATQIVCRCHTITNHNEGVLHSTSYLVF